MIELTITGLALVALLPTVRSAPGLSRTPGRVNAPAILAFEIPASSDPDRAESASSSGLGRPEEDSGDTSNRSDEGPDSVEWMAARPSRAQGPGRTSPSRWAAPIAVRPAPVPAGQRPRFPFATVKPGLGLSVGLCRLLL